MRYNVLKSCAALSCRACVDETTCVAEQYLTLRTGCSRGRTPKVVRPQQRKNPLPYSFSKRSHIGNLRRIRKQGKGRSSKRKGNRRCPFLFAPCGERRTLPRSAERNSLAEFQRKTFRPERANSPAAVRVPRLSGAEKEPPCQGEHACGSSRTPAFRCRKGATLSGRTRSRSSCAPLSRCRKQVSCLS